MSLGVVAPVPALLVAVHSVDGEDRWEEAQRESGGGQSEHVQGPPLVPRVARGDQVEGPAVAAAVGGVERVEEILYLIVGEGRQVGTSGPRRGQGPDRLLARNLVPRRQLKRDGVVRQGVFE